MSEVTEFKVITSTVRRPVIVNIRKTIESHKFYSYSLLDYLPFIYDKKANYRVGSHLFQKMRQSTEIQNLGTQLVTDEPQWLNRLSIS